MYKILTKSFFKPKLLRINARFITQFNHANQPWIHSKSKLIGTIKVNLCSKPGDTNIFSTALEEDMDNEIEEFLEEDLKIVSLKNLLYPDTKDEIMIKLNEAKSCRDILEVFELRKDSLSLQQTVQTIILLWDHVKLQVRYILNVKLLNNLFHTHFTD